jgi:hypothetical protein
VAQNKSPFARRDMPQPDPVAAFCETPIAMIHPQQGTSTNPGFFSGSQMCCVGRKRARTPPQAQQDRVLSLSKNERFSDDP